MKHPVPEVGRVHEVPYPFVRDTWADHYDVADDVLVADPVQTWKPGTVASEHSSSEDEADYGSIADGIGVQILTVVGVYKPGRYPTRVFYSRQWRDPDGKVFGKTKLRMTTVAAFAVLVSGYRHPFSVRT